MDTCLGVHVPKSVWDRPGSVMGKFPWIYIRHTVKSSSPFIYIYIV